MFWLALGLGAGVTVALVTTRWVRRQAEALTPAGIGRQAAGVARDTATLLRQAAAEFRAGMTERERELRSAVEGGRADVDRGVDGTDDGWLRATAATRSWETTAPE